MTTATATPKGKQDVYVSTKGREVQRPTPVRALSQFEEVDRMFESFFPRAWTGPMRWARPSWNGLAVPFEGRLPSVNVLDRDAEIFVRAEVPGVERKDLDVSVTDKTVTIKGFTPYEDKEEKGDYYCCEISRGAFTRTVALPGEVNCDKAKAIFKDGVLEMTLPKLEMSKRHSIKVD